MAANSNKPIVRNASLGVMQVIPGFGKYGILGMLGAVDGNILTDQAVTMPTTWLLRRVIVTNASVNFNGYTTADGNIHTAVGGGGTALLAIGTITTNMQLLTAAAVYKDLTLATLNVVSATTVYWRMSTAFGGAGTFDLYFEGVDLTA